MRPLALVMTFALVVPSLFLASGCASQMALVKGSSKKTVVVKATLDEAFNAAAAAGKELGYKVSEKRAKNFIGANRGMGYAEFSTVYIRFTESGGVVSAAFDANSNKGSQAVLDDYLAAYAKLAKLE
jgi:hypothetical protein